MQPNKNFTLVGFRVSTQPTIINLVTREIKFMTIAIDKILKNGIIFDLKNWDNLMKNNYDILMIVDSLFNTLEKRKINYLLVGGIALLSYIDGRNTQDINLILSPQDLKMLPEITINDENNNFIRGNFNQLQIDILLTKNKLFHLILKKHITKRQFGERVINCVTVEGLIILKLYALPSLYRQGKFDRASIYENDVLLLLLNYSVNLKPILTILKKHLLNSDIEQIQEILLDIEARIKRFARQQKNLDNTY